MSDKQSQSDYLFGATDLPNSFGRRWESLRRTTRSTTGLSAITCLSENLATSWPPAKPSSAEDLISLPAATVSMNPHNLIDLAAIRQHCELLHRMAAPFKGKGKLSVAGFGENPQQIDPKTGQPASRCCRSSKVRDRPSRTNGEIHHRPGSQAASQRLCALGRVAGQSRPKQKGQRSRRYRLARAGSRFRRRRRRKLAIHGCRSRHLRARNLARQISAVPAVRQALSTRSRQAVAVRLKSFCGCDHGTVDVSHVWRVPGTLNWPNRKKIAEGRRAVPQLVRVIKPLNGQYGLTLEDLAAALPPKPEPEPNKTKLKANNEQPETDASSSW